MQQAERKRRGLPHFWAQYHYSLISTAWQLATCWLTFSDRLLGLDLAHVGAVAGDRHRRGRGARVAAAAHLHDQIALRRRHGRGQRGVPGRRQRRARPRVRGLERGGVQRKFPGERRQRRHRLLLRKLRVCRVCLLVHRGTLRRHATTADCVPRLLLTFTLTSHFKTERMFYVHHFFSPGQFSEFSPGLSTTTSIIFWRGRGGISLHHFQDNGLLKLSFCHWEEDIIEHTAHTICHLESITNIHFLPFLSDKW